VKLPNAVAAYCAFLGLRHCVKAFFDHGDLRLPRSIRAIQVLLLAAVELLGGGVREKTAGLVAACGIGIAFRTLGIADCPTLRVVILHISARKIKLTRIQVGHVV